MTDMARVFFCLLLSGHLFAGMDFDQDVPVVMDERPIYEGSYALVIGVWDYGDSGWSDLPGVEEDVAEVEDALKELADFDTVIPVYNPNLAEMKSAITSFLENFGGNRENRLLIYYAGHGASVTNEEGNQKGYIVPAGVPLPDGNPGEYGAVAMDWLRGLLGEQMSEEGGGEEGDVFGVAAKHVMFVFDSCFSGTIFSNMRGGDTLPPLIADLAHKQVHQFISSGSGTQLVPDVSIFRREFIAALAGSADLNRDGYITGTEIGIYLRDRVSNSSYGTQTPQFSKTIADGDMVFESPIGPSDGGQAESEEEPAEEQVLAVGDTFKDCADCPELAVIPAGVMWTESVGEESESGVESGDQEDGGSLREVAIERPFAIGVYEITSAQWNTCFSEGGCRNWLPMPAEHSDRHPVAGVTREDAEQYVAWLSRKTGRRYRLPTEEQWEYAARAGSTTARHWGEDIGLNQAACDGCGSRWDGESAAPVGSFPANRFGLHDLLGNLWEWTSNCSAQDLPYGDCVIKGGSWATDHSVVRSASKGFYPAEHSQPNFGLRVVRDL